ncbi:uncharacterized protein C6orf136 homolog isoform X2 [Ceratina calcarata]|uniref:Uncharacterized protein C6orf136 homolog isoform X2 n=1 Tax=Ceratina calcarata TaxID=156304 RepID=A0AAJ7NBK6_9HYME|nr:uncharacterized protein C6orf136 homolog isoform X2 [Ceratina calcarata]
MSSYLRSVPNKFTSFVNTRRQVTNIDHQLPKHVKSSLFLEERQINIQTLNMLDTDSSSKNLLKNNADWERTITNLQNKDLAFLYIEPAKRIFCHALPNSERKNVLYSNVSPSIQNVNETQPSEDRKPSEAQLQSIFDILREDLPLLFVKPMDYRIYTQDLQFVNNIKGTVSTGLTPYMKQIMLLKLVGHLKYAYIKLNILKMTMHPEDSSIKVRWRIVGISGTRVFLTFWKFKVWNVKEQINDTSAWYDGFSTFYINNDGKIFKHVVDKMMPDQDVEEKVKTPIEPKLALFTALLSLIDMHYFVKFCSKKYLQSLRIK